MRYLERINTQSDKSVVEAGGPIVSLTTFEPRWSRVFYTLESIGSGTMRPSRLVLWVASSLLNIGIPEQLIRLQRRGLEIKTCEDIGSHKKYYPLIKSFEAPQGFVTCDDDVLYPEDWLQRLVSAAGAHPHCVIAHRTREIQMETFGAVAPYETWPHAMSGAPDFKKFAIGIGGVLYPPAMVNALRGAGEGFRIVSPRADDVWLKAVSLRAGLKVSQASDKFLFLIDVPGMRESGLAKSNVLRGGNDEQIKSTFSESDLMRLLG
jgi:hypothetical protein